MKTTQTNARAKKHIAQRLSLYSRNSIAPRLSLADQARARRVGFTLTAVLFASIGPSTAIATEGGGSSKALGVDTVLCGVMPDPGLLLTTYLGYYNADHTLDSAGNDRTGISNFHLRAEAATFRFQQVWSGMELWGANIETRLGFTAYVDVNVHFDVQTPNGTVHKQSSASGTADALLGPALLGWHGENLHQIAGVEFFLPTGHFDQTKLVN